MFVYDSLSEAKEPHPLVIGVRDLMAKRSEIWCANGDSNGGRDCAKRAANFICDVVSLPNWKGKYGFPIN